MRNSIRNKIWQEMVPYVFFALAALILWKYAALSFCASDEAFYASTTNRFIQGDAIFVHEWFPTQLVSLILLPFQSLFVSITGTNDGILLFMRYVYIVFSTLSAVLVYNLLKDKESKYIATCCALFVMFYAHLNIATMSYYTLSYHCFLLSMLFFVKGYEALFTTIGTNILDISSKAKIMYVIAGFFFALSVLSLPSLAVVYFLVVFFSIVLFIVDIYLKDRFPLLLNKAVIIIVPALVFSFIGIIVPAIAVLIYVLPRSGLMGIINNLGYVLTDEEHITSLVAPFKKFFLAVLEVYKRDVYLSVLLAIAAFVIYLIRDIFKKNVKNLDVISNVIFFINLVMFVYYISVGITHTGYLSTAIALFSIVVFFLSEKKNYPLLIMVYIGGMIFSMVYSYSSNGDLYVLSIGHSISAIAGICFIWDYNKQGKEKSAFMELFTALLIAMIILLTATLRFINVYRDAPIIKLTETISEGPAAGLKTTPEHKEQYDLVYRTIKENEAEGNVFFTKLLPWGYLATDMRCGAPTTWRTKFNSERLRLYYTENPNKIPDVIFVMPDDIGAYDTCGDVVADPTPNENEFGGYLEQIINENNYTYQNKNGIDIYTR